MNCKFAFVLLLISLLCIAAAPEDPLKFVVVFLRHGARSARSQVHQLKKRVKWDNGKNALTPSGQRQQHLLGSMMRRYFVDQLQFMPQDYNASLMVVRASDISRTIMSAHSFLLGFYPKSLSVLTPDQLSREHLWTPPINLTLPEYVKKNLRNSAVPYDIPPIPIQSHYHKMDKLLSFSSCKRFSENRHKFYKGEKFKEVHKAYNATLQRACGIVGIECGNVEGRPVWEHVDSLLTAEFDGQLPELSKFPSIVEELEKFYTDIEYGELTYEPELTTPVAMHDFSKTIPKYLEDAIKGVTPLKMAVLSTHESTILAYFIGMGLEKKGLYDTIPYASNILIELRKKQGSPENEDESYYVNMTYNGRQLISIQTFKEFKQWLEKKGVLPGEWDEMCEIPKGGYFYRISKGVTYSGVGLGVIGVISMIIGVVACKKQRKSKDELYHTLILTTAA